MRPLFTIHRHAPFAGPFTRLIVHSSSPNSPYHPIRHLAVSSLKRPPLTRSSEVPPRSPQPIVIPRAPRRIPPRTVPIPLLPGVRDPPAHPRVINRRQMGSSLLCLHVLFRQHLDLGAPLAPRCPTRPLPRVHAGRSPGRRRSIAVRGSGFEGDRFEGDRCREAGVGRQVWRRLRESRGKRRWWMGE